MLALRLVRPHLNCSKVADHVCEPCQPHAHLAAAGIASHCILAKRECILPAILRYQPLDEFGVNDFAKATALAEPARLLVRGTGHAAEFAMLHTACVRHGN